MSDHGEDFQDGVHDGCQVLKIPDLFFSHLASSLNRRTDFHAQWLKRRVSGQW